MRVGTSTTGATRVTCPGKARAPKASTVRRTSWPARISGAARSATVPVYFSGSVATTVKSGVLSLTNSPTETWRLATTPVSGAGTTVSVRRFRPSSTAASRWRTSASAALMAPRSASSWDSAVRT